MRGSFAGNDALWGGREKRACSCEITPLQGASFDDPVKTFLQHGPPPLRRNHFWAIGGNP